MVRRLNRLGRSVQDLIALVVDLRDRGIGPPPEGLPRGLGPVTDGWYRSRLNDDGWTAWEKLSVEYRHPPQGMAAIDPAMR